ncbi:DUF4817 domain-containing protein [Trichonephila clavipes]|uniref:DUF4817 domain-containing protein n=1 Tax=Trichonephila clavipes TaxID=2585209 RepID=A0A8X6W2J3_TRICX|nr:DUF4817 domain-containing protein [Trichonephila clavipes]
MLPTTIFIQYEAIPHIGRQVKELISANFGDNRVTSRHFPDTWPSRSPDFNDLWLWGFLKDRVYIGSRATIDLLKYTLGDRLISRFGPANWPPRSCDLTPLDYFLWGYVKSLVYADKPQTLDHLEDNIRRVIADIRPQMLEKVIENWTSRLDYIRASRVSPMPEIIFKMHPPKSCWLPHRGERVFLNRMGEERWELAPGRSTLDVKAFPLCSAKINRNWSQDRLLPSGAPILGSTEATHFRFI